MGLLKFDDANFEQEVLGSDIPVLVDFWAPWCGPCKALEPTVEEVANELGGKAKIGKVNIDESPKIASNYQVMSIPTLLVFKDGKVFDQMVGVVSKDRIIQALEKNM